MIFVYNTNTQSEAYNSQEVKLRQASVTGKTKKRDETSHYANLKDGRPYLEHREFHIFGRVYWIRGNKTYWSNYCYYSVAVKYNNVSFLKSIVS